MAWLAAKYIFSQNSQGGSRNLDLQFTCWFRSGCKLSAFSSFKVQFNICSFCPVKLKNEYIYSEYFLQSVKSWTLVELFVLFLSGALWNCMLNTNVFVCVLIHRYYIPVYLCIIGLFVVYSYIFITIKRQASNTAAVLTILRLEMIIDLSLVYSSFQGHKRFSSLHITHPW